MNLGGQNPIFWICIALIILLAIREIRCWYWKINEMMGLQEDQYQTMQEILKELREIKAQNIKESTKEPNDESTP